MRIGFQVTKTMGQRDLILQFAEGAKRDIQKMDVVGLGVASAAFDDVRRNGDCCPAHLRPQPEKLLSRERTSRLIYKNGQLIGQLKRFQLGMITHRTALIA